MPDGSWSAIARIADTHRYPGMTSARLILGSVCQLHEGCILRIAELTEDSGCILVRQVANDQEDLSSGHSVY